MTFLKSFPFFGQLSPKSCFAPVGGHVTDRLKFSLFKKLSEMPLVKYNKFKTGEIAHKTQICGELGDLYITQTGAEIFFPLEGLVLSTKI